MNSPSSFTARRAFVDSSGYYAVIDRDDDAHADVMRELARLEREHWRLVTSNYVIAETHALVLNRVGRTPALTFLRSFATRRTEVIRIDEDDERNARAIIERYTDKRFSLTDATSFAVMERLGIAYAFTFDSDFVQYGFPALGPGQG